MAGIEWQKLTKADAIREADREIRRLEGNDFNPTRGDVMGFLKTRGIAVTPDQVNTALYEVKREKFQLTFDEVQLSILHNALQGWAILHPMDAEVLALYDNVKNVLEVHTDFFGVVGMAEVAPKPEPPKAG